MNHNPKTLRKAAAIADQIIKLQRRYAKLMGDKAPGGPARKVSAATKAKMAAAASARWARARKVRK